MLCSTNSWLKISQLVLLLGHGLGQKLFAVLSGEIIIIIMVNGILAFGRHRRFGFGDLLPSRKTLG